MAKPITVALVNDYTIVLEGLRSLLQFSEPEIHVIEIAVRKKPRQRIDVTLLDTYGELSTLSERVHSLSSDPSNGVIVVFSFSDQPQAVRHALSGGAEGFISNPFRESRSSPGSRRLRGVSVSFSPRGRITQ